MTVTLRDCATQEALGPPFRALLTFHQGGTVSESAGTLAFAPNQRTAAHGWWAHAGGMTYTERMVAAILFDTPPNPPMSPGFQAGWQVITSTFTLVDANTITATGLVEFFDLNRQPYRRACPTSVGERFR